MRNIISIVVLIATLTGEARLLNAQTIVQPEVGDLTNGCSCGGKDDKMTLGTQVVPQPTRRAFVAISEERRRFALQVFQEHPDKIDAAIKEKILMQQVVEGMDPYEAYLAWGQFTYKIKADRAIWPAGTDPFKVMSAQTLHPDDSKISMFFQNDTQFPEEGLRRFRVDFIKGRVVSICKLQ